MIALNLSCGALGSAPLSMVKLKLIQIGGLIPAIYIYIQTEEYHYLPSREL